MLWVNRDKIDEIGDIIKKQIPSKPESFTNTDLYPSDKDDVEDVLRYFFVMVALDHRTSRPNIPYETKINGKLYHGADLLYRLGKEMYSKNREFFSPEHLCDITEDEIKRWLNVYDARIPDPGVRAFLLRDLGWKLLRLFDGSLVKMIKLSNRRLFSSNYGFIEILKVFRAYEDPVEKKAFLLYKFLERRGLFVAVDREKLQVPVDNHLTRLAVRLGLIKFRNEIRCLFDDWSREATYEEDIVIRFTVRRAYKLLSNAFGIDPMYLDDFLWSFGRTVCKPGKPLCWRCPLVDVCDAGQKTELRMLKEHYYYSTWYY